ncbi:M16 family metallopeptidase [Macrococcoides caseolyticum]
MQKYKLENGVYLATESIENVNVINLGIFIASGSIYENNDTRGYSHFIEHLLFRTKKNGCYLIDNLIQKGVKYGAFTTKEYTCYYFRMIPDEKEFVIKTISEMFESFESIEEVDFDTEKNIILSELRNYQDDPRVENINNLMGISFTGQSIANEILGDEQNLVNSQLKEIKNFYKSVYTESRAVVSITGSIDTELVKTLKQRIEKIKRNETKKIYPILKFYSNTSILSKKLKNSIIDISFSFDNKEGKYTDIELYIFNDILGGMGKSSLLFNIIREKLGLTYTIQSYIERFNDLYIINIHAETEQANIEKVLIEISYIFNNIDDFITKELIDISYKNYVTNLSIGLESPMDRMFFYGNNIIFDRHIDINSIYEYKKPSRSKILSISKEILLSEPSCSIIGEDLKDSYSLFFK